IDALRNVKTIIAKQSVSQKTPEAVMTSDTTSFIEYPDKFRVEAGTTYGNLVQGFDGRTAWTSDPQGSRDVPREVAAEAKNNLDRDVIRLLIAGVDGRAAVRRLPDGSLEFTGGAAGPVTLSIDPSTSRVSKE